MTQMNRLAEQKIKDQTIEDIQEEITDDTHEAQLDRVKKHLVSHIVITGYDTTVDYPHKELMNCHICKEKF